MGEEYIKQWEKELGYHIERKGEQKVSGTLDYKDKSRFIYFSDDKKKHKPGTQFFNLAKFFKTPVTHGGMHTDGCKITIPDGTIFYAVSYHGDLEGWKKRIEYSAEELGLLLAWIEGDKFTISVEEGYLPKTDKIFFENNKIVISDGRSFLLSECQIELY